MIASDNCCDNDSWVLVVNPTAVRACQTLTIVVRRYSKNEIFRGSVWRRCRHTGENMRSENCRLLSVAILRPTKRIRNGFSRNSSRPGNVSEVASGVIFPGNSARIQEPCSQFCISVCARPETPMNYDSARVCSVGHRVILIHRGIVAHWAIAANQREKQTRIQTAAA